MTAMLETKNLGISFGGLKAVDELTMTIEKGQLYGLIGPNGAGKTLAKIQGFTTDHINHHQSIG